MRPCMQSVSSAALSTRMSLGRPVPHRCSGRLEDFVLTLARAEYRDQIGSRWRLLRACLSSSSKDAPTDAYLNEAKNSERPYDIVDQQEVIEQKRRAWMQQEQAASGSQQHHHAAPTSQP